MASLTLKISPGLSDTSVTKTIHFDPTILVYDACRIIRNKLPMVQTNEDECGLFLYDIDPKKGVWLEPGRTFEYYLLRNGDLLEYKSKQRLLKVRMLDGTVKTLQVDDSHSVDRLMITVCSKIGITNHEEYSLVRDLTDAEKEKTLTLKRGVSIAKDQKKMDEMKKKLHTDDELIWLDHTKTLREQMVTSGETLLLRRKFFFSDQNVDAQDPIQLNLLYVQTRDAILKGSHPINQEMAVQFAGLMCQIQFGDHMEHKHKPGFLDLKEVLPKEYVKVKSIEKRILYEHNKLRGLSEVDSKLRYNNMARSLKTYGIAFFLVKEKLSGKNKLVPRLLGVTKDAVVRVDEKTKEVLKTWSLTQVKRWAASPNTFTLDFGDYADSYYSVQTIEGERIAQLIAGYIDIILKKIEKDLNAPQKLSREHTEDDSEEVFTMYEDNVAPARATIIQQHSVKPGQATSGSLALPGIMRSNGVAGQSTLTSHAITADHARLYDASSNKKQALLLEYLQDALHAVDHSKQVLHQDKQVLQQDKHVLHQNKKALRQADVDLEMMKVACNLKALSNATATMMASMSHDTEDYADLSALGSSVHAISANMKEFSKGTSALATLQDSQSAEGLMEAAVRLVDAFSMLLSTASSDSLESRQSFLKAASMVGEAGQEVMSYVNPHISQFSHKTEKTACRSDVAETARKLVSKARNLINNPPSDQPVNQTVDNCILLTSELVACNKLLATVDPSSHQQQLELLEAARDTILLAEELLESTGELSARKEKLKVSKEVLREMLACVQRCREDDAMNRKLISADVYDSDQENIDKIVSYSEALYCSLNDTSDMVEKARVIALATSSVVNSLKTEAHTEVDKTQQKRLLAAAKRLADATSRLVEAAKACATESPNQKEQEDYLFDASEHLKWTANQAILQKSRSAFVASLADATEDLVCKATQMTNSAMETSKSNRNQLSKQQLLSSCQLLSCDYVASTIRSLSSVTKQPGCDQTLCHLVDCVHDLMQPIMDVLSHSKTSIPTIEDQSQQLYLSKSSNDLLRSLNHAKQLLSRHQAFIQSISQSCHNNALFNAMQKVKELKSDLETPVTSSDASRSRGEGVGACSKKIGSAVTRLLTSTSQNDQDQLASSATETAASLSSLVNVVKRKLAMEKRPEEKESNLELLSCCKMVVERVESLLQVIAEGIKDHANNPKKLAQVAKAISQSLSACVSLVPGLKPLEETGSKINNLTTSLQQLQLESRVVRGMDEKKAAEKLCTQAVDFNTATVDVVVAAHSLSADRVATASKRFSQAYEQLLEDGLDSAALNKQPDEQQKIVGELRGVSLASSKLLLAAKSLLIDPTVPVAKNNLNHAARAVTESVAQLVDVCTTDVLNKTNNQDSHQIAYKELQDKIKSKEATLKGPLLPQTCNYHQCIIGILENSKSLAEAMTNTSGRAREGNAELTLQSVSCFAESVCRVIEYIAQAAYLTAISDPSTQMNRPTLVTLSEISLPHNAIKSACLEINSIAESDNSKALSLATIITKHTSTICNACRAASFVTTDVVAKKRLVQVAKDIATNTSNLVRSIKQRDSHFSSHTQLLLSSIECLTEDQCLQPSSNANEIGWEEQEDLQRAGLSVIDVACQMVAVADNLPSHSKDHCYFQEFPRLSHELSECMKGVITSIKDSIPGTHSCNQALSVAKQAIATLASSISMQDSSTSTDNQHAASSHLTDVISSCLKQLLTHVDPICQAVDSVQLDQVSYHVSSSINFINPLANSLVTYSNKLFSTLDKQEHINQSQTVLEAYQAFIGSVKNTINNFNSSNLTSNKKDLRQNSDDMRDSIEELSETLQRSMLVEGLVDNLIERIHSSLDMLEKGGSGTKRGSYVDHQSEVVVVVQTLIFTMQDIASKVEEGSAEAGVLSDELVRDFSCLVLNALSAAEQCSCDRSRNKIRTSVRNVGQACIELIRSVGQVQALSNKEKNKEKMNKLKEKVKEKTRAAIEETRQLSGVFEGVSGGIQACISACLQLQSLASDLDTSIMFANAGALTLEESACDFSLYRENILKTARMLVEDTKALVASSSQQQQLQTAAKQAASTVNKLADFVKDGAASLGANNSDSQVLLLNAVKDVTSALGQLIEATKNASGSEKFLKGSSNNHGDVSTSNGDTPEDNGVVDDHVLVMAIKESAKVMVAKVTALLKTVKMVEDKSDVTGALEHSIEFISNQIKAYNNEKTSASNKVTPPKVAPKPRVSRGSTGYQVKMDSQVTPEEIIRVTRSITSATVKAVAAGHSGQQSDVIAAANMGRKAINDLLKVCKGGPTGMQDHSVKDKLFSAGRSCATAFQQLLSMINQALQYPHEENKQQISHASKEVAISIKEIIQSAEAVRDKESYEEMASSHHDDDRELLRTLNSFEVASNKLNNLLRDQQGHPSKPKSSQVLTAAHEVSISTQHLIKTASSAYSQASHHVAVNDGYNDDYSQWHQNLISACDLVAAAVHNLTDSVKGVIGGVANNEKLLSAAKQVASCTAQLLVVCKVRIQHGSPVMRQLQTAGNGVKKATERLVESLKRWMEEEEGEEELMMSGKKVSEIAQMLMAQQEIVSKEKQLEGARKKLEFIRKQKYKDHDWSTSDL